MSGKRLDAAVRAQFQLSWNKARDHIGSGKILVDGNTVTDPAYAVSEGAMIELRMSAPRLKPGQKPAVLPANQPAGPAPRVVHLDSQVLVVSKPSGLNTVQHPDDEPAPSLEDWACGHLKQSKVVIVQRLDRETSGLIVLARTQTAGHALAQQFRFRTVHRRYLALAHGEVRSQTIRSALVENRGDGLRGSRWPGSPIPERLAKEAITHVRALKRIPTPQGPMTLIECALESGRTHQIRIHLSEAGHPLVGERLYVREFEGERIAAPRIMLHAAELGFTHPTREAPMSWTEQPPEDFQACLAYS